MMTPLKKYRRNCRSLPFPAIYTPLDQAGRYQHHKSRVYSPSLSIENCVIDYYTHHTRNRTNPLFNQISDFIGHQKISGWEGGGGVKVPLDICETDSILSYYRICFNLIQCTVSSLLVRLVADGSRLGKMF